MGKSYRKTPKAYKCNDSAGAMKEFKRRANKIFRLKVKRALLKELMGKDVSYPKKVIEGDDLWSSPADGNQAWFGNKREDYYIKRIRK